MLGLIVAALTLMGAGHRAPPPDPFAIRLQTVTFDPMVGEPDIPAEQRLSGKADDDPTTYLVQFTGPVQNEWKVAVEQTNARLYGYIPNYTFIARMDLNTAERVQALSFVRWVGLYHPFGSEFGGLRESRCGIRHCNRADTTRHRPGLAGCAGGIVGW